MQGTDQNGFKYHHQATYIPGPLCSKSHTLIDSLKSAFKPLSLNGKSYIQHIRQPYPATLVREPSWPEVHMHTRQVVDALENFGAILRTHCGSRYMLSSLVQGFEEGFGMRRMRVWGV